MLSACGDNIHVIVNGGCRESTAPVQQSSTRVYLWNATEDFIDHGRSNERSAIYDTISKARYCHLSFLSWSVAYLWRVPTDENFSCDATFLFPPFPKIQNMARSFSATWHLPRQHSTSQRREPHIHLKTLTMEFILPQTSVRPLSLPYHSSE